MVQKVVGYEEFVKTADKEKFMIDFVKNSRSFEACRPLIDAVLQSNLPAAQKWMVLDITYGKYKVEALDYALNFASSERYMKDINSNALPQNEVDSLDVTIKLLAYSEKKLEEMASRISQNVTLISDKTPIALSYFGGALIFRKHITNEDDALRIARKFVVGSTLYSLHVSVIAAKAVMRINTRKGEAILNEEYKTTLNPVKKEALKEILNAEKTTSLLETINNFFGSTPKK
ncbi:MAG: hypothetical protein QXU54_00975 [Candidatus Micrarchaeia archaeon]